MKYSKQRSLILDTLRQNPCHPTAEQIFALVRQKDDNISLATVYRNLNRLAENGMIRKLSHIDKVARFDHTLVKHYHFICTSCSRIIDIDSNILPSFIQQITDQTGLAVESADISLKGICPDCLRLNQNL